MESYICTVLICMITLNVLNILVFENNRIKKEKKSRRMAGILAE